LDEVEPLLEANGLLLLQPVLSYGEHNLVTSRIYHVESGQYLESSMKLVGDNDMQKSGSGITYARRYTLGALLSMKAEDDDGNSAVGKATTKPTAPAKAPTPVGGTADTKPAAAVTSTPAPAQTAAPVAKPSFRKTKTTPQVTNHEPQPELVSQDDL